MWERVIALWQQYWPYSCVGGVILVTVLVAGVANAISITHHSRG